MFCFTYRFCGPARYDLRNLATMLGRVVTGTMVSDVGTELFRPLMVISLKML